MHIEIHIFPEKLNQDHFLSELYELNNRIHRFIQDSIMNGTSGALGEVTLLDNNDSGKIVATVKITKGQS